MIEYDSVVIVLFLFGFVLEGFKFFFRERVRRLGFVYGDVYVFIYCGCCFDFGGVVFVFIVEEV